MSHTKLNTEEDLVALQKGVPEVLVSGKTVAFRGGNYDQASFLQLVNTTLAPYELVNQYRTLLHQAIAARDALEAQAADFVHDAKAGAEVSFGENSVEFSKLGFEPKKKAASLTPEQKQLKQARLKATRKARGTMGRKQKERIKGVVTPESGGSQPAPSSTPTPKT